MNIFAYFCLTILIFLQPIQKIDCICYFPLEMQGEFLLQQNFFQINTNVRNYTRLNISDTTISFWGSCHSRLGEYVLLNDQNFEFNDNCLRCFQIQMLSHSVIKIRGIKDFMHQCYTSESLAIKSCPKSTQEIDKASDTEFFIFRSKEIDGNDVVQKEYCPLIGKYSFTYKWNNLNNNNNIECYNTASYIDTCPSGSTLTFYFHKCFYRDQKVVNFQCMAHWFNKNKEFIILHNIKEQSYHCSLLQKDERNELITLSISNESNCEYGIFENDFYLIQTKDSFFKRDDSIKKRFPTWLLGKWQDMIVTEEYLIYKDKSSFKTYFMKISAEKVQHDKYLVSTITQCDEEDLKCIRIKNRSENLLELQIGLTGPATSKDLCADDNFQADQWIPQTRVNLIEKSATCPIRGAFIGQIPDSMNICANLTTSCKSAGHMQYKIYMCENELEVLEEREYRCLGQWYENELLYTYTKRIDLGKHEIFECFVGYRETDDIFYIKEAGPYCQRHDNLLIYKMQLRRIHTNENCNKTIEHEMTSTSTIGWEAANESESTKSIDSTVVDTIMTTTASATGSTIRTTKTTATAAATTTKTVPITKQNISTGTSEEIGNQIEKNTDLSSQKNQSHSNQTIDHRNCAIYSIPTKTSLFLPILISIIFVSVFM